MNTAVRVNNRKRMHASVENFDDEPRELLCLSNEKWGLVALPETSAASRTESIGDKLVKRKKENYRTSLNLGLFGSSVVSTLLYGCESWKLTEKTRRN